jgi:hypothetical protein
MRFLGVALVLVLASCGGSNDSDTSEEGTEVSTEAGTDAVDERCVDACSRIAGCFDDFCDEQPLTSAECISSCDEDPDAFNVEGVLAASCAQINASICVEEGVDQICDCPSDEDGENCLTTYGCFGACPIGDDACVLACFEAASPGAQVAVDALNMGITTFCADAADVQACTQTSCSDEYDECFTT